MARAPALETFWRNVSEAAQAQPVPAHAARRAARTLDARLFTGFHRHGSDGARVFALRAQPDGLQPAAQHSRALRRLRAACARADQAVRHGHQCPHRARPCVSQQRPLRPTSCSLRHACRPCFRPSRSTASRIGTAAIPAIPPSPRWCANAPPRTRFSSRSIRCIGTARRAPRATFSIASTRSPSTACCSRSCA